MIRTKLAAGMLMALTVLVASPPADACDEAKAAIEAAELRQRLLNEATRLQSWRITWTAVFTGAAIGQLTLAELAEDEVDERGRNQRRVFDVGAIKAGLGAASTPILSARISVPPRQPQGSACDDLIKLRAALVAAARRQSKGISWKAHVPGFCVNVAGVLYLGFVEDLWIESLVGGLIGSAVGSLKVLTQPQRAIGWQASKSGTAATPWISQLRIGVGRRSVGLSFQF